MSITMAPSQQQESTKNSSDSDVSRSAPPDGGWGWVVVFSSFMIHFIVDGITYTFGIFYTEFLTYFQDSKGNTAWVASIMAGMTFCIGPVASGLTNKYGCRAVTIGGSLLATSGMLLSILAPNIVCLYFTVGLCTGAGFGLMYLPSIVSISWYFEKKRAFATGVAVCGSGMGTFALAPLTEYLVDHYGWKGAMLIISGLVLNCCVFGALFRPLESKPPKGPEKLEKSKSRQLEKSEPNGNYPSHNQEVAGSQSKIHPRIPDRLVHLTRRLFSEVLDLSLMRDVLFLTFSLSNFFTNVGFDVPYVYTKDRAIELGIPNAKISFLLSVIGISNTIGRVVLGFLSDRKWVNRLILYNISLTVAGLVTVFSSFCYDYASLMAYSAVFGCATGAYVSLTAVILVDLLGLERLTNAFGLLLMLQGVACFIGPPITGWLYDWTKSYDAGFYVSGSMIALSGIMLFFIPCIKRAKNRGPKTGEETAATA